MNTFLSSAQNALKEQYRAFAQEHVAPIAKGLEKQKTDIKGFWRKLGQLGYLGLTVPKEHGGSGGTFFDLCLFTEEICQFDPGLGLTLAEHIAVVELINRFGSVMQKARYLPLLARGESIGSLAVSEREAGTDYQAVQSQAKGNGSNIYLTGKKVWVVNAELAAFFVVLLRYTNQICLWLVDSVKAVSCSISPNKDKLGLKSSFTNDVEFLNHKIAKENLLGGENCIGLSQTEEQVLFAMDVSKVIIASSAVGLMQAALAMAVEHAGTREQFGSPISNFQAIQWKIADLSVEYKAAQLMMYRAAWSKDKSANDFRRFAAMSKILASKAARIHSAEALQIMGSTGLSVDSPMEKLYRDAKVMEICEGTSEFQKIILMQELGI